MSYLAKKGTITLPTSAGSVVVNDVGFQPKALILWCTEQTATGFAAQMGHSIGFATGAAEMFSVTATALDATAAASATAVRRCDSSFCLIPRMTTGGSAEMTLALASLDAGGFTLTLATPGTASAIIVHYLALGGDELADAYVGNWTPTTSTGNKALTGVGFQPDMVMTLEAFCSSVASANSNSQQIVAAFTAVDAISAQMRVREAINPTQVLNWQIDKTGSFYMSSSDVKEAESTLVSMDADGYTLNYTTRASASIQGFLCLKGGEYYVGRETQKTSTGTKAKTGVGFEPSAVLLFGCGAAANASVDLTQAKLSFGASDGTAEGSTWSGVEDNVATSDANSGLSTTKIIQHNNNPSTTVAEADLVSMDADGFTLDWTTADTTAREFAVVAFGSTPVGGDGDVMLPMGMLGLGRV